MLPRLKLRLPSPAFAGGTVRIVLILFFLGMVARHWTPHYGLTRLLQVDADAAAKSVPALRSAPVYVHPHPGSYDGWYYAQIATDPSLHTPELRTAIDDLGYRARRILLSGVAWLLGRGDPVRAVRAYAWLNVGCWLALALLLWRVLPCADWRATVAWIGLMFATGTLTSVRLALTDLAALMLTVAALVRAESARRFSAAGWLGAAALARETAVLAAGALLPRSGETRHQRRRALLATGIALLPLAVWLAYVWSRVGSSSAGLANFAWPGVALVNKVRTVLAAWHGATPRLLVISSVAGLVAMFAQSLYLVLHPARDNPWWRTGILYVALMLCLGPAVWGDDLPGAAVRVLLPVGLAFNVCAVRASAAPLWLFFGNLWILGGVPSLWPAPRDPHTLADARFPAGTSVATTGSGWYVTEARGRRQWAWCTGEGLLTIRWWPREAAPGRVMLRVQGITARDFEVRADGRVLWQGALASRAQTISFVAPVAAAGRIELQLLSRTPAEMVGTGPAARRLSFSVSEVWLE
jgi:hypothetical protein